MLFSKVICLVVFFLFWSASVSSSAGAELTSLYQSVERALQYSPQLQAATYNYEAIGHDVKRARGRYLPSVDLLLGYGLERFSDRGTRREGADPSDTDWDPRGDASLGLTQMVYDGGETRSLVSVQEARQDSADFLIQGAAQAIALSAITAHLEVYRQRDLVALAEKDLRFHEDIGQSLSDMERAGAGNPADVLQTQARLARAQSTFFITKANLARATANYVRVVGTEPGELSYAEVPGMMPGSLEQALRWTEQRNPELLALNAKITEADSRVSLARSAYKPKINVELGSRYHDQLEGDPSWQMTNDAMVVMRWNLFNGGQTTAEEKAAISRKSETRSTRDEKWFELREAASAAWAVHVSRLKEEDAYRQAVAYGEKSLDAYLKQFSVSKRSLLEVLDSGKEYFQSAALLVTVSADKIISAYRILALAGELKVPVISEAREHPAYLSRLTQTIPFPSAAESNHPEFKASSPVPTQGQARPLARPETQGELKPRSGSHEPLRVSASEENSNASENKRIDYFVVEVNGLRLLLANGETLQLVRGEELKIIDILPQAPSFSGVKVNFKGFVGDPSNNTGEDRGFTIRTGSDLMRRFSLDKKGEAYEILANQGEALIGRAVVKLTPPKTDSPGAPGKR